MAADNESVAVSTLPSFSARSARTPAADPWWPRTVSSFRDSTAFDDELSLADYVRLLRRWWWLALLTMLTVVGAVVAITMLQTPMFTSSSTVLIRTSSSSQLFPLGGSEVVGRTMAAEGDFLTSTEYLEAAATRAGNDDSVTIDVGDVAARVEPSVIRFTASSPSADQAAITAQAWAESYIDSRHEIDLADVKATISTLEATRDALDNERKRVSSPIDRLDGQIEAARDEQTISDLSAQRVALLQTLNAQLQPIDTQLATVNTELAKQALMADFLADPEVSARVNTVAETPSGPSSPRPIRNLALASVVGAILAVAAVVGIASFDDRLRTTDDVEAAAGMGNLAAVPFTRTKKKAALDLPSGSLIEESFQRIVSAIDFAGAAGQQQKVLLVTSPQPGEGKTSTAARLAMALAEESRKVLVVGGDLRRPTLSVALGADSGPGLADYLSNKASLDQCLHRVEWRRHLVIMPAGRLHDDRNPAEVLRSQDLAALIAKLRDYCDHIIIDGPPLLPVVDALELAAASDAVVLSLFARKSRGRAVQRAVRLLDEAGSSPVLGYVLNGVQRGEEAYSSPY